MRVLFCRFGGLGESAIGTAFYNLGCEVEYFDQKADNYDYDKHYLNAFVKRMEQSDPDYVFSINFLPIVSKVCDIFHKLYISWIYDCPEMHLYSSAIANSVNRIFLFDRQQYDRFYKRSPNTVFYMPLATEPMSERQMKEISEQERERYQHEICFIGSLYNEKEKRFHELNQLPDYWRGFVDGIVAAQLHVYGYNFIADSLSDSDVKELTALLPYELVADYQNVEREVLADMYIGPKCSAMERMQVIKRLSGEHKVSLYTDSDITGLNVENCGIADSLTMMPKIFHCSKINLNITSKTIQSGIPLRVFDVLGSKGFLISNYQVELCEYFEPDVDLVVYEDLDDLSEKVNYYLTHEEERIRIAQNGYRKVCNCYTYEIALRQILEMACEV